MGFRQVKSVIQIDSIDEELLNGLWNAIMEYYYSKYSDFYSETDASHYTLKELSKKIWIDFFKEPIDEINLDTNQHVNIIRSYFFDEKTSWYDKYDLLEFIPNNFQASRLNDHFMERCNKILEREVSVYRFIAGKIVAITTTEEIQEIEGAITDPTTSDFVKIHLSNALKHLADRESPDYRTSIKESISAVECIAKVIVGSPNTTLGAALNQIKSSGNIDFHQDLNEGLKSLNEEFKIMNIVPFEEYDVIHFND